MSYLKIARTLYKIYAYFHKKAVKSLDYQQIILKIHDLLETSFQAKEVEEPALALLHAYLSTDDCLMADAALLDLYRYTTIHKYLQGDLVSLLNTTMTRLQKDAQDFPVVQAIESEVKAWCEQHQAKKEPSAKKLRDEYLPHTLFQTAGGL